MVWRPLNGAFSRRYIIIKVEWFLRRSDRQQAGISTALRLARKLKLSWRPDICRAFIEPLNPSSLV